MQEENLSAGSSFGNTDHYTWRPRGPHFVLSGFPKDALPQFGTDVDPNRTLTLIFEIDGQCTTMIEKVPIRDRMQSTPL